MSPSPREYLRHMLDEIDYVLSQVPKTDFESFCGDATLKRSFVRSLEVMGEAAKRVPENVRKMEPDIEWQKIAGMRNRLIHDYFGVDYTIVWDVVTSKLPGLRVKLQRLLDLTEERRQRDGSESG